MLTSTTFELPGMRIVRCLGVVRGITVRTRALPMTIIGSLETIFGGGWASSPSCARPRGMNRSG